MTAGLAAIGCTLRRGFGDAPVEDDLIRALQRRGSVVTDRWTAVASVCSGVPQTIAMGGLCCAVVYATTKAVRAGVAPGRAPA